VLRAMAGESLEIQEDTARSRVVLHVAGELDFSTAGKLSDHLADAVDSPGPRPVVLDRGRLAFWGLGLRVLVAASKLARAANRRLTPARVPKRCLELLRCTGPEGLFDIHDTVEQATAAKV
jgi:anti-sigma B factor antagonist